MPGFEGHPFHSQPSLGCNCGLCDCGCVLASIGVLKVEPNEVLLVKTTRVLHPDHVKVLEDALRRLLPEGTQCIIVMPDLELTVVPTEGALLDNLLTMRNNMKGTAQCS